MNAPIIIPGTWTIRALHDGKRCFAQEYIDGLQRNERVKLLALLEHTSQNGPPKNKEKFNQIENGLLEFKSFQDRLFCFYQPGNTIVLTHGFRKKKTRLPRREINKGIRLMQQYLRAKGD